MTLIDLTRRPVSSERRDALPVAIIGAGPIGLAAAANLVERGIDFVVFEAGDSVAIMTAREPTPLRPSRNTCPRYCGNGMRMRASRPTHHVVISRHQVQPVC